MTSIIVVYAEEGTGYNRAISHLILAIRCNQTNL